MSLCVLRSSLFDMPVYRILRVQKQKHQFIEKKSNSFSIVDNGAEFCFMRRVIIFPWWSAQSIEEVNFDRLELSGWAKCSVCWVGEVQCIVMRVWYLDFDLRRGPWPNSWGELHWIICAVDPSDPDPVWMLTKHLWASSSIICDLDDFLDTHESILWIHPIHHKRTFAYNILVNCIYFQTIPVHHKRVAGCSNLYLATSWNF